MYVFLLTLLILDGILLMVVVLLQAGKGGGLAAMGGVGTDSFIGGRQAANLLTKTSWATGGIFLALSLILAIMSSREQQPAGSILREEFRQGTAPATQPAPALPGAQPAPTQQEPGATQPPPAGEQPEGR